MPNPIEIDRVEYTRMYRAAVDVLQDYGFRLNRHSHRFGLITTQHQDAPSAFEPWRPANTSASQAWENTLNHQRYQAVVSIEPVDTNPSKRPREQAATAQPASYRLRVEVFIERHQTPGQRLNGSTASPNIYDALDAMPQELKDRGIERAYWLPLGRDPDLEQHILADIVRRSMNINPTEPSPIASVP